MARLALAGVGAAVGSAFGAPQLGFALGSMLGGVLFPGDGPPDQIQEGPRLHDLKVQSSAHGTMIPFAYGTVRIAGNVTYSKPSGITRLTAGVRFKAAERTEAYLMLDNGSSANRAQIRADLTDGSVPFDDQSGTFTLVSHSVTDIGDGWYLLVITVDVPTAADTITLTLRLYNGSSSYAGDDTSGIYAWGVQLVEGNLLGDYVAITDTPFAAQIDGADTHQITTQYQSLQLVSDGSNWLIL